MTTTFVEVTIHKVYKTEGASDQFPIWIFNFWPYGQLRAVRGKNPIMNYEQLLSSLFFHVFKGKFFLNYFFKYCSILTKNLHKSLLYVYIFFSFFSFKIGCPRDLNPACKTRDTLRQVLFYLFFVTFMEPFLNRNAFQLRFWEHFSLLKIWKTVFVA